MSCYSYCHHIRPNGSRTLLDHDRNTMPGRTFYYCSIHRVYHCIQQKSYQHRRHLQQPLCGECAWLFFRFPGEAERRPASDLPAFDDTALADVAAAPRTRDLSASPQGEIHRAGGNRGSGSQRSVGGACESDDSSVSGFEAALNDINRYISRGWIISSPTGSFSSGTSYSSSVCGSDRTPNGSASGSGASERWFPERAPRQDPDGDVVMADPSLGPASSAGAGSEPEAERAVPVCSSGGNSTTTTATAGVMVDVPICDRTSVLDFIPYDDPSTFDVRPLDFHAKYPELFMFRYTDFAGQPAVQPTSAQGTIQAYFAPLDSDSLLPAACPSSPSSCANSNKAATTAREGRKEEERVDSLLLHARWWSCWAQGFQHLEPELRWLLTLVFDFANVMAARQALGGYGAESPVFWRARHVLHDLLGVAEDLAELYGIPNIEVPRLDWFAES
ncbi:hypothetical protein F5X96DRAFT_526900 [Biscogniauxia mediterranea]|nr:hypothetical protein F5X96DRAFT_526900 [Biscogniauxia mediterranea]